MDRLVCFDSNVVIWGIKKQATPSQLHMIAKTEKYIEALDKSKIQILIPSVVIAEILSNEPKEKHGEILKELSQNKFVIGHFNTLTAKIFSELFGENIQHDKEYRTENQIRKDKMKLDYMIVATAIENNASYICSNDIKDLEAFSKGKIRILNVPEIPEQAELIS